jgi:Immunoglobulin I-set domain
MKRSPNAPSTQNGFEKFAQYVFAGDRARQLLGVLALIVVLWVGGCAASNTVPVVTTQPASQTVTAGASVSFTAAASGTPVPTVQWQVSTNGGTTYTPVSGATSATLTFTTTASQNASLYEAVFTNSAGSATSTPATLTVNSAPAITTNPANVTVVAPATATFTAAASGTPAPSVQWQVSTNGGTTFTNISGATSATFAITPTTAAMTGNQYKAVFTNSVSSATTTAATLTVNTAPVVTTNPTAVITAAGNTATFTAAATGQPNPTVQWMVSTNGGTSFAPVAGATSTTLSFTTAAGQNGNLYEAVFSSAGGTATTTTALLTVNFAPTITTNPAALTIGSGGTATFTAAANGNPAPTVQWFVSTNGGASFNAIGGATSTTLSFTALLAQSGNLYEAVFTNSVSTATTSAALLTVGASSTVSVAITNPGNSPITLGTGGTINVAAAITNGAVGIGVNWSVNGIAGGNSTVGTITASTLGGALAAYIAPATAPGSAVSIVATYAGAGSAASAPFSVNVVTNHNSTLSGQVAFQVRGFGVSGLPFGMVGTFTANGAGALSAVLIDTNTVQSAGGGSLFTSKVAWNGSYSMDTVNHGIMHLTLASSSSTQMNFGFTFNGGNGAMVEIDTPLGSTASGTFSASTPGAFTLAAGGVTGPYVMRLDGPATGLGNGYNGLLGQVTFAQTGSSPTAGTIAGSMTINDGSTANIVGGTVALDADGSGHAVVTMPLDNTGQITLSAYVSSSGRVFTLESDSSSSVTTGVFRSQTIPSGGFTAANIFTSAMLFEAIGVDPTTSHASVIVGNLSPGVGTAITGVFDANNGGTLQGSPAALTGTFTVSSTVPGLGTLTFTNGLSFVFYMRSPGQGFILEATGLATSASRIGQIGSQTVPAGGFVSTTLNGLTQTVGTQTTTPASLNGIAVVTFPTGTTFSATADGSALAQNPFIAGTATGAVAFTDAVRGRGTVTSATGSVFGAATTVFYAFDNTGAAIMISTDPTTHEPQIVTFGN